MKTENNKLKIALYVNINLDLLSKVKIMNFNLQTNFTVKLFLIVAFLALVGAAGFFLYFSYFQPLSQIPPYRPELQVCKEDPDCAVGIRLDACCCGLDVYSKEQIKKDKNLEIYEEGKDYSSKRPMLCRNVICSPCKPILGAVCSNNRCQEPQKWDEILRVCANCYIPAALAAYKDNNYQKAIQLCAMDSNKDECFLSVAREAMYKNKITDALKLCREELKERQGTCLRETAQEIAKTDIEEGLKLCREAQNDNLEKDNCFHNIAVIAREKGNISQSLGICQMMSTRVEDCKDLINRYCDIYPQYPGCSR